MRGIDEIMGSSHKQGLVNVAVALNKRFGTSFTARQHNNELEQICRDLGIRFNVDGEIVTEVDR